MIENRIKISIIVPIFNSESTLERCLNSLVSQSFDRYEIILVNDGSTDNSERICNSFGLRYPCIRYYYIPNSGVSEARNIGLKEAVGDYILFCDSDDYYEKDALQIMYNSTQNGQIDEVVAGVRKHYENKHFNENVYCKVNTYDDHNLNELIIEMYENYMLNQLWGKLFKTSLISGDNQILFNSQLSLGEDLCWMCEFMKRVSSAVSISSVVYNYFVNEGNSLSRRFLPDYFSQIIKSYNLTKELIIEEKRLIEYEQNLSIRLLNDFWVGMSSINRNSCTLSFFEKVRYIKNIQAFPEYVVALERYGKKLKTTKYLILKLKSAFLQTFFIMLITK